MSNPNSPSVKRSNRKKCNAIISNNNNVSDIEDKALASVYNLRFLSVKQFMTSTVMLDQSTRTLCKIVKRMHGLDEHEVIGPEYVEVVVKRYTGVAGQPKKLFKIRIPLHLTQ